jgi:uncharacterized protein
MTNLESSSIYFLITASALSYAFSLRKRFSQIEKSRLSSPTTNISSLSVYPVKGCRAVSVSSCEVACTGLAFDRHWMIVSLDDEENGLGRFVSQRECPKLAVMEAAVFINGKENGEGGSSCFMNALSGDNVVLRLCTPSMKSIDVPLIKVSTQRVSIWKSTLSAFDQGDMVSYWLKEALSDQLSDIISFDSSKLRLVHTDGNSTTVSTSELCRPLSSSYLPYGSAWIGPYLISAHNSISFADGYPVLLASEASLRDLNHRIVTREATFESKDRNEKDPFIGLEHPMTRFRPNIVVDGENLVAWEEDSWAIFAVRQRTNADNVLKPIFVRGLKRCARCMVTTTDQQTGLRGTGDCEAREPLATLSTFRRSVSVFGGIMFGINVLFEWREIGMRKERHDRVVSVGDEVVVIERGSIPPE